jgi:hypothetical protein
VIGSIVLKSSGTYLLTEGTLLDYKISRLLSTSLYHWVSTLRSKILGLCRHKKSHPLGSFFCIVNLVELFRYCAVHFIEFCFGSYHKIIKVFISSGFNLPANAPAPFAHDINFLLSSAAFTLSPVPLSAAYSPIKTL